MKKYKLPIIIALLITLFASGYYLLLAEITKKHNLENNTQNNADSDVYVNPFDIGRASEFNEIVVHSIDSVAGTLTGSDIDTVSDNEDQLLVVQIECEGKRADFLRTVGGEATEFIEDLFVFNIAQQGDVFGYMCSGFDCTKAVNSCLLIRNAR